MKRATHMLLSQATCLCTDPAVLGICISAADHLMALCHRHQSSSSLLYLVTRAIIYQHQQECYQKIVCIYMNLMCGLTDYWESHFSCNLFTRIEKTVTYN